MPTATISETSICNMALTLIGATQIDSLTDTGDEKARKCNAVYAQVRNDVLTDFEWTFAQKRVALEESDTDVVWTDDFVTVAYDLPTDFLKLNAVNQRSALVKLEGSQLLSDTSELEIKYTYELTDTTHFRPKFIQAFVARLAAELAIPISNKSAMAERLFTIYYEKKLPQAISKDSQMGTPQAPAQNEWLNARKLGAGGDLIGQTSWDTFYPINWWY